MAFNPSNPLVIQSDKTVLLEVNNDLYPEARDALARFAELEKSPEYIHTYRITPLSLWNAAAAGLDAEEIVTSLARYSKYDLPANVRIDILEQVSRYGRLKLNKHGEELLLSSSDQALIEEILRNKHLAPLILGREDATSLRVDAGNRSADVRHIVDVRCRVVMAQLVGVPADVPRGDRQHRSGDKTCLVGT